MSTQLCTSAVCLRFPTVHEEARGHSDWKHIDERYLEGRRRHVLEDLVVGENFEKDLKGTFQHFQAFSHFHKKTLQLFFSNNGYAFHMFIPRPAPLLRVWDPPNHPGTKVEWYPKYGRSRHRELSSLNRWQPIDPVTSRSTRSSVTWIRSSPLCWWSVQASSAWSGQLGR